MPHAHTDDGIALYYEEAGSGTPVVFVHEFAGDLWSWEPQLRHFARRFRVIAFNARGYPPSDVPERPEHYSQARAVADIKSVLDHLGVKKAHVVGLSMGGFATLHFGLTHPQRALSLVVAGCGYGAEPERRAAFQREAEEIAASIERDGMEAFAARYGKGPTRVQFANKDPRGFAEFRERLARHSARGSALTQLGVQRARPSLYDFADALAKLEVPTLIVTGDEDWPCLNPGLFLKRTIPTAALAVIPNSGHTINLEEPETFNRLLDDFFAQVEAGRWPRRDPRTLVRSSSGMLGP